MVKTLYTIFIAVLIATFVGVGIAAFYPSPKSPNFTTPIAPPYAYNPESSQSSQYIKDQQANADAQNSYMELSQIYSKNVSVISLILSILILIVSLTLIKNIQLIADGAMLGGVLTLIYSIFRGFSSESDQFRFIVVTIGLIVALAIGFIKFIKPASKKK